MVYFLDVPHTVSVHCLHDSNLPHLVSTVNDLAVLVNFPPFWEQLVKDTSELYFVLYSSTHSDFIAKKDCTVKTNMELY